MMSYDMICIMYMMYMMYIMYIMYIMYMMYVVYMMYVMYHVSCIMYHVSCIMYYVLCIMYHVLCIMYHVSCINPDLPGNGALLPPFQHPRLIPRRTEESYLWEGPFRLEVFSRGRRQ